MCTPNKCICFYLDKLFKLLPQNNWELLKLLLKATLATFNFRMINIEIHASQITYTSFVTAVRLELINQVLTSYKTSPNKNCLQC